jgi:hypothetical protein
VAEWYGAAVQIDLMVRPSRALGELLPDGMRQKRGSIIPSPDGTTLRYEGMIEYRGVEMPPEVMFALTVAAGVSAQLIAEWIIRTFGASADHITIDRQQIDLDDEGNVRRVIEERIKVERK